GQQPFTYSYFDQPDWIQPDDPSGGSPVASPQVEFIYLHLFEQEVSAVEDSDLKDVALGGPDTTQRLRLIRRVERLPVAAGDCASALAQAQGVWLERGLQFDPPTMQLLPQAALQVGFTQSATPADPCDPVATGGYRGGVRPLPPANDRALHRRRQCRGADSCGRVRSGGRHGGLGPGAAGGVSGRCRAGVLAYLAGRVGLRSGGRHRGTRGCRRRNHGGSSYDHDSNKRHSAGGRLLDDRRPPKHTAGSLPGTLSHQPATARWATARRVPDGGG